MNERIRELAEQAAQESFDDVNELLLDVSLDDQSYQVPAAFIARLSELIVEECIHYCGENLSKTVGGALQIHLGVKE